MTPPTSTTASDAASALLEYGYAIIKLPEDMLAVSDHIMREGLKFFQASTEQKERYAVPEVQEGYLGFGAEKDGVTGRPDLSESFKVWFRNIDNINVKIWSETSLFHNAMNKALLPHAIFIEEVLLFLKQCIISKKTLSTDIGFDIRSESYMQMNFSRPVLASRDTISDTHEDGHILTLVRPSQTGFMGRPGSLVSNVSQDAPSGLFQPDGELWKIEIDSDEAVLIPSVPTFYLTGGLVKPFFHSVGASKVPQRQSLMFFSNPARSDAISPWNKTDLNRNICIRSVINSITSSHINRHGWIISSDQDHE